MAFLGNKSLEKILTDSEVIKPFDPSAIKNGSYELSLGSEVFLTDSNPKKVKRLIGNQQITVAPGQFALLLTEETIHVPLDKIAFISIKATVKFKGLVNVSGFHVDPGFKGKLLFSVYNAGSFKIYLSRGSRYFPIWFADLDEEQIYNGTHKDQIRIPDDPVEALAQGEMSSPAALQIKIDETYKELKNEITLLQNDHNSRNYLAGVALAFVITLVLKLGLDWIFATSAVNREYEIRQKQITADSLIHDLLIQKRQILQDIDSLERKKQNLTSP